MMRILMLSQFYPPFIGGEERIVWSLSTELAARGHQVVVATMWAQGLPDFEEEHGVRIYRLRGTAQRARFLFTDPRHSHAPPFPDPEIILALRRIIHVERPQVVHAHNWMVHSFLPLKQSSRAKLVLSLHDYSFVCATKKLIFKKDTLCDGPGPVKCLLCAGRYYGWSKGTPTVLANWGMGIAERRMVDMFTAVSHATARGNRLTDDRLPYRVIWNFMPSSSDTADDVRSYLAQLPKEPYLLFVGALGRYKGIDVLVEAYSRLHMPPPLVLIGYDISEHPVATSEFPLNVFVFKNWPHAAVVHAWGRSLFGLFPSIWHEPFALTAVEATMAGRPAIASNIGGLPDIIVDGESGILVAAGDVSALEHAMRKLLTDSNLRQRLAEGAVRRSDLFHPDNVIPQYESLYKELVAQGGTQTSG